MILQHNILRIYQAYKKYNYGKFKNVSDLASNILTLPTYPEYSDSTIDLLCDLIKNFYNGKFILPINHALILKLIIFFIYFK